MLRHSKLFPLGAGPGGLKNMKSKVENKMDKLKELIDALEYITHAEATALQYLVQSLPFNPIVVNIGAGAGTSGLAIMQARPDVHLTTIDKQLESSPFGCLSAETQVLKDAGVDMSNYSQIHGNSSAVRWEGELIDMVFVDGDHLENGVRGDILNWEHLIKENGIMVFHDYKKIDAWIKRNPGIEITPQIIKEIKPWKWVDFVVDELMELAYQRILLADSLVAYRI